MPPPRATGFPRRTHPRTVNGSARSGQRSACQTAHRERFGPLRAAVRVPDRAPCTVRPAPTGQVRSESVLQLDRERRPRAVLGDPGGDPAEVLVETPRPGVQLQHPQARGTPGDGPRHAGARQPGPPGGRVDRQVPQRVVVRDVGEQTRPVRTIHHINGDRRVVEDKDPSGEHVVGGIRQRAEDVGETHEVRVPLEVTQCDGVIGTGPTPRGVTRRRHRAPGRSPSASARRGCASAACAACSGRGSARSGARARAARRSACSSSPSPPS